MFGTLSRSYKIRAWWHYHSKEVILMCVVGLITAAVILLLSIWLIPIPEAR